MEDRKVIVIRETVHESWLRDAGSMAAVLVCTGIGWAMGSEALQWAGAASAFFFILARAATLASKNERTIAEAREYLDKLEREAD